MKYVVVFLYRFALVRSSLPGVNKVLERIIKQINKELSIPINKINGALTLLEAGNTIPFIARYRKEVTGCLDEEQIRKINERYKYLENLETNKQDVIKKLKDLEKCTPDLETKIFQAESLKELEDLYRPYRPKRKTKATVAKQKGLEPLASKILELVQVDPDQLVNDYIAPDKGVCKAQEAWQGAMDIVAEIVSEDINVRNRTRNFINQGMLVSKKKSKELENEKLYQDYFDYEEEIAKIPPHRILAIDRGENEKILQVTIQVDKDKIIEAIEKMYLKKTESPLEKFLKQAIKDSYTRLIKPSINREIRKELTQEAHLHSIEIFTKNLRNLLLQPPMKDMTVLGIDPGYISGCKLAIISSTNDLLAYDVIYPHKPQMKLELSKKKLLNYIKKYSVDVIVIGNGTACRETEELAANLIKNANLKLVYTIVNEAGASVYSASSIAREEFPDLEASYRGTVSIARRFLDPLAELVKIDPKSLGIGLYQHDINAKLLDGALQDTVESVVNYVGVDINRASPKLLSYVAGINQRCARNIVSYRAQKGYFKNRMDIKKVVGVGDEIFTQCAGFLKILNGNNPLDNTSIHPESYPVCTKLLNLLEEKVDNIVQRNNLIEKKLQNYSLQNLLRELNVGEPTLKDILNNLKKPGRDPRDEVPPPIFRKEVLTINDLQPGMTLEGTVRNVVDFGAFVDIGVKIDGLVHISQMSDSYVKNSLDICQVGDTVEVKVLAIDKERKRIALSMK